MLTADHGATYGQHFYGKNKPDGGDTQLVLRADSVKDAGSDA